MIQSLFLLFLFACGYQAFENLYFYVSTRDKQNPKA